MPAFTGFIQFNLLFTSAAGLAVAAAFFGGLARRGKHFPAVQPFGNRAAVGTTYFVGKFFNKLVEFFAARGGSGTVKWALLFLPVLLLSFDFSCDSARNRLFKQNNRNYCRNAE